MSPAKEIGGIMERRLQIGIAGLLVVGVLALVGYLFLGGGAVVSAQGVSVIEAEPDLVSIYINAQVKNESASVAKDELSEISDKVVFELMKLGLEKKDIELGSYNIYEEYNWEEGKRESTGFVASQQIIVKTGDFELSPEIVDVAVDSGALVSYINFELSPEKESQYKTQALEEAGKDAKAKAEATASGLGKSLGTLISVESQDFHYGGPVPFYAYAEDSSASSESAEARKAAIDLAPRDVEVRASIVVKYKLRSF